MTITPCNEFKPTDFGPIEKLLKELVNAQFLLGKELIRLAGDSVEVTLDGLGPFRLPKMKSCCAVPDACWMPLAIGEVNLHLVAGGTGEIHFTVTNGDYRARTIAAKAAGQDAGLVQLAPSQAMFGPKERGIFMATITAPAQVGTYEALIWILGCRDHYLRVTVMVGAKQKVSCYKVTVEDNPDNVVHWYDHFYCKKACLGSATKRGQ